jgi:osmotically inducible protein OsmC
MALAGGLEGNGTPAERVHTDAECTVERVGDGFTITRILLRTRAKVPDLDVETFQGIALETKKNCPVSRALSGVQIDLEASLE